MDPVLPPDFAHEYRPVGEGPLPDRVWCGACGYELTGLGVPEACPECGMSPVPLVARGRELSLVSREDAEPRDDRAANHRTRIKIAVFVAGISLAVQIAVVIDRGGTLHAVWAGVSGGVALGAILLGWRTVPLDRVREQHRRRAQAASFALVAFAWVWGLAGLSLM